METASIIIDIFISISCLVLSYLALKLGRENVELRKDLSIVLHHIPVANSAEYVHLVKKYAVKDLNLKEHTKNE